MIDKRITKLLKKYQNEVSNGDMTHLNDLIATMVISDLTKIDDSYLIQKGINNITLGSLLGIKENKKYMVPNKYEIYDNKKKYERNSKLNFTSYISQEEVAANTWIDMLIKTGMINESEEIMPNEFVLGRFIKDINLKEVLPMPYRQNRKVALSTNKDLGVTPISPATKKVLELRKNSGR